MKDLPRKLTLSLLFGLAIVAGLALFADLPRTLAALAHFTWSYLPVILGLTLLNYVLRFFKWHYYLHAIGARGVSLRASAGIWVAGLSMAMTPGKAGELFKSFLLRETAGVSMSASAPVIMAERLTDGIAMLLLAAAGLGFYSPARPVLAVILGGVLTVIVVVQVRPLAEAGLARAARWPLLNRYAAALRNLYESSYQLLRWRNLLLAVGIGVVSWSGECLAFYLVLRGVGLAPAWDLALMATFILAFASLVGAVSALPGGLGAAETSITGLLLLLVTPSRDLAVAATLLIRFCTLWFGVSLGLVTLVVLYRKLLFGHQTPMISNQ